MTTTLSSSEVTATMTSSDGEVVTSTPATNSNAMTSTDNVLSAFQPEFDSSFLQHATAQIIAGFFAWGAILITCHQVRHEFLGNF